METKQVIHNDLSDRIERMQRDIETAKALLKRRNYLQCAVRLQKAAERAQFDTLTLNVFDSMTTVD